jgi:hypothetical protein
LARRIRKHKAAKGLTVRSGFEAKIAQQLETARVAFEYETLKLKYTVPAKMHTYTPDFEIPGGIVLEAKGLLTSECRRKMLYVKQAHPDLDIRFVLQRDNPIRKGSKTRYSTWCERNGFPWCVGTIPEDWLA